MESTFQKISRKTGKKPSSCKCQLCKSQCRTPCLPTPEDVQWLTDAGYADRLMITDWGAGIMMGVYQKVITMIAPRKEANGYCTFYRDGLCELHDKRLKPTEGKLSHHTTSRTNFDPKRSLAWNVAKEWLQLSEYQVHEMLEFAQSSMVNAITTTHALDFEAAPWEYDPIQFTRFRIGTCEGIWAVTDDSYDIVTVVNNQPGNAHLQDVFEWFEYACRRDGKSLRVLELLNDQFKAHLINKRGFTDIGNNNLEKRMDNGQKEIKEEAPAGSAYGGDGSEV